jgi:hypothetical protein
MQNMLVRALADCEFAAQALLKYTYIGLFTPNAGQHFRDEQRRRRSQYDRGTRLAELEEYDYETAAVQRLYTPQ